MSWMASLSRPKACVCIELGAEYLSFAVRDNTSGKLSCLASQHCPKGSASWLEVVQAYIDKHQLQGLGCRLVLPASEYQLLLVEAPEVPEAELRQALTWRVKDLLTGSVEESVVDVFSLPAGVSRGGKAMAYVVAANKALILSLVDLCKKAELKLQSIDIEVLAIRNLLLNRDLERGAAVVRLRSGSGDVSIYRNNELYLSRNFKLAYGGGLLDDLPVDQLALEVQRSLDYFERQMGQIPPGILLLTGEGIGTEKITEHFKAALSLPVELLDPAKGLDVQTDQLDEGLLQLCTAAIGGLLRVEGE
ncbi:hypothetical protein [Agaribacterium sp. ZY112]|uniref:hypothetical protein n=1 Tax=Agaribacterium sp. ZY112 TaxID=3233574 RepID=UPI003523BBF6